MNKQYNFKEIEEEVQKFWKKNNVESKTIGLDEKKKLFSFLEGPPTANAPPGLHHVEVRVFKDLVCRYKFMKGFSVPRKGGWDCHGLPVEVQVEKALGLKHKKEVIDFGISRFTKQCRESVFSYINEWEKLSEKMAFWLDYKNPYITLKNEYIESVWWALKELHSKNLLFEGHKVVPFCPRCETPLSSHEVSLGYEEITEETVTLKFFVPEKQFYLLAWTTTPWTLPSNLALAVNPKIDYALIESKGEQFVLANALVKKYFGEKAKPKQIIKGKELVGLSYKPLFDYFEGKLSKKAFIVIPAEFVSTEEGTGVVHMAPAFGEEDFEVCSKEGIDFVQPINSQGIFSSEIPELEGKFVKDVDKKIVELLEEKNLLFAKEKYSHSYPFCWRCNSPLIYYAMKSWFIGMSSLKEKLLEENKKINWVPSHIKDGRFGEWLENVKDWALSRKKFWGTPLNIWRCKSCGKDTVIGSIKELKEKSMQPLKAEQIDLHKPFIDSVFVKCECGKIAERVEDVIDCWFDSGSASFAQFHYPFENQKLFEKSFPYDFISEAIDQTRGWFYTLHALGVALFGKQAFKTCVSAGHMVDVNGEKMSKSKNNIINPWDAFEKQGVDAVRLQFCITAPGVQKRFGIESVNESVKPFLNILWNSFNFSQPLILAAKGKGKLKKEDEWIISRINSVAKTVEDSLEKHAYHHCLKELMAFVNDDLSRTYIKIVRDRAAEGDQTIGLTLKYVFERLSKILAPFAPYLSEKLFLEMGNKESIHLQDWPKPEKINEELEQQMSFAKELIQGVLFLREKAKTNLRWPLKDFSVKTEDKAVKKTLKELNEILLKQCNVKEIVEEKLQKMGGAEFSKGKVYLNTKTFEELEIEGYAREIMRRVQDLRKTSNLKKEDQIELFIGVEKELKEKLLAWSKQITERVGAKTIAIEENLPQKKFEFNSGEKIKEKQIQLFLSKAEEKIEKIEKPENEKTKKVKK